MNMFHEFFQRAMGGEVTVAPYPYQTKFATQATLPHLLRVPTSAGKTATAILGWLYRWQTQPKETPRRLVYCLAMRVLVEQSEREARRWISNLGLYIPVHVLMGGVESVELREIEEFSDDDARAGGPQPRAFRRCRSKHSGLEANRAAGMFRLAFSQSILGPLSLGYANHFGLGLSVPATGLENE